MKKITWILWLLVCISPAGAVPLDNVARAVERAAIQAAAKATDIEPHLTQEQLEEIPLLLFKTAEQVRNKLGIVNTDERDVIEALSFYFAGYNPLEARAVTQEQVVAARAISDAELAHALQYALVSMLPASHRHLLEIKVYPPVQNWDRFYQSCQGYMEDIYYMLATELSVGNGAVLEEVFCNDPD